MAKTTLIGGLLRSVLMMPLRLIRLPFDLVFLTFDFLRLTVWGFRNFLEVLGGRPPTPFKPRFHGELVEAAGDESRRICTIASKYGTPSLLKLVFAKLQWYRDDDGSSILCWVGSRNSSPTTFGRYVGGGLILALLWGGLAGAALWQARGVILAWIRPPDPRTKIVRQTFADTVGNDQDPGAARRLVSSAAETEAGGDWKQARDLYQKASELDRSNIDALLGLGRMNLKLDMTVGAKNAFERALALDSKQEEALLGIATVLQEQGSPNSAMEYLDTLLLQNPSHPKALAMKTHCLLARGKIEDAVEMGDAAIVAAPDDAEILAAAAVANLRSGNLDRAEGLFQSLIDIDSGDVEARLGVAEVTRRRGKLGQAESLLEALHTEKPDNPHVIEALADIRVAAKKPYAALALCRDAAKRHPDFIGVRERLCGLLQILGMDNELYKTATALLRDQSGNVVAHVQLATMYLRKGLTQEAVEHAKAAEAQAASNEMIYRLCIRVLLANADNAEAQTHIERILRAYPDDLDALLQLAEVQRRQNQAEQALATLKRALAAHPKSSRAQAQLGQLHFYEGRKKEALAAFRAALALAPDDVGSLNNVAAAINLIGGDPNEALGFARRALELAPNNPQVLDTMAWILASRKEYDKALPFSEKAMLLGRGNPAVRYHYASILAHVGRKKEALRVLRRLLASGVPFDEMEKARTLFKDLTGKDG